MKQALIVILLAAGIAFAVSHWFNTRQPTAALHDAAQLKRELDLTVAQAQEVETSAQDFQTKLQSFCAAHCEARIALGNELGKPKPDTTVCRASVEKMNAAQADAERLTLEHILKVRALLTDEQAQRYSRLIRDQVCNMPMGAP